MDNEQREPADDTPSATEERALTVRLPVARYRVVRTVAVTRDLTNGEVIAWAIDLLERHVNAGGEP